MRLASLALALLTATASAQTGCAQQTADAPPVVSDGPEVETLTLGASEVQVVTHRAEGAAPLAMLNLHDDEGTSVDAALDVIRAMGGQVVEVQHTGDRNVTFEVDGTSYTADPNRMFTDAGRERTLASLSTASPAALAALAAFADEVLAIYAETEPAVVVTLHNNTEDNYSAASYTEGAPYASDAAAVVIHEGSDPDDFFFVTDAELFRQLAARGFNAVLQDNDAATDDGSLSVWAAQNGRPYVNVEAQHGHREEQARMIRALAEVLAER